MTVSKIVSIQGSGDSDTDYGKLYKFDYTFEDGTVINARHKTSEPPFEVGQEAEYEVRGENKFGKYGAVKKPPEGDFRHYGERSVPLEQDTRQKMIVRQNALNRACDLYISKGAWGENFTIEDVKTLTKELENFVFEV